MLLAGKCRVHWLVLSTPPHTPQCQTPPALYQAASSWLPIALSCKPRHPRKETFLHRKKKNPKRLHWNLAWLRCAAIGNRALVEQVPGAQGCLAAQLILG